MRLNEYQRAAAKTDQFQARKVSNGQVDKAELVPLLGLTGEVGALLSEYKKLLRDGPVHMRFKDRVKEELGDTLWYVAAVASKFDLTLEDIARANLNKVSDRWAQGQKRKPFDTKAPRSERLPQRFVYTFANVTRKDGKPGVALQNRHGQQIGDTLTDNSYEDDGYRFHDVMHFAFVAILGWSPVARKMLSKKRKSSHKKDEVEDGGRANVIDEAIVAMVFDYIQHDLGTTAGMTRIDSEPLRGIRALTRGFEVYERTEAQWEEAILKGLAVWRQVDAHGGGEIEGDFLRSTFEFRAPTRTGAATATAPSRVAQRRQPRSKRD